MVQLGAAVSGHIRYVQKNVYIACEMCSYFDRIGSDFLTKFTVLLLISNVIPMHHSVNLK